MACILLNQWEASLGEHKLVETVSIYSILIRNKRQNNHLPDCHFNTPQRDLSLAHPYNPISLDLST